VSDTYKFAKEMVNNFPDFKKEMLTGYIELDKECPNCGGNKIKPVVNKVYTCTECGVNFADELPGYYWMG